MVVAGEPKAKGRRLRLASFRADASKKEAPTNVTGTSRTNTSQNISGIICQRCARGRWQSNPQDPTCVAVIKFRLVRVTRKGRAASAGARACARARPYEKSPARDRASGLYKALSANSRRGGLGRVLPTLWRLNATEG